MIFTSPISGSNVMADWCIAILIRDLNQRKPKTVLSLVTLRREYWRMWSLFCRLVSSHRKLMSADYCVL